ncbi:SH3 domain-containing protein [Mycena sanguinolenta]|uniref:Peroxisomal membrane protein PEX13 n=1 Tax=Mycena sanguinolenta TaxID=230812 RepID=A0A8H7CHD3_9AGAR|nr:SH3 domain-containing protein [Mycena sanguinolenta]
MGSLLLQHRLWPRHLHPRHRLSQQCLLSLNVPHLSTHQQLLFRLQSTRMAPRRMARLPTLDSPARMAGMAGSAPMAAPTGGYGSAMGYGGYGMSPYSSMGMGMSPYGMGMNGMGMGMNGVPLDANGLPIPTLTQTLESTTQHTFQLLHSIVQTFSGVAQMLESTFMATHSSFFAMVGVIDQFGHLRNALGSVLGLFGLMRWMRELLTGTPAARPVMQGEFRDFVNGRPVQGPHPQAAPGPKPSKKPLIIFLLAIFGIPYAMTKLVQILNERARNNAAANGGLLPGQPLPPLDPSALTFARALYPFTPTTPSELALKENEIVAIMGKLDPRTGAEVDPRIQIENEEAVQWWKGRTREGREGWFPRKWVEILEKKEKKVD